MSKIFSYKQLENNEFESIAKALSPLKVPLEQTPYWGEFDNSIAGRKFLGCFRYDQNKKLVALASATLYKEKLRNWIWIKHGPLFAAEPNTEIIQKMCATLTEQFSNHSSKPVFIRLTMPNRVKPMVLPFEHTMYDQTVIIDLAKSEDELLASMSQSGRQGIRKAIKYKVAVKELSHDQALENFNKKFYPILSETASRGGFGIHPAKLYLSMIACLPKQSRLYGAYYQNEVVAWAITTEYRGNALYYYGASNQAARESHAPYLLHWEIIKAMKTRSNKTYDFMGIAGKNYPSLKNVTQFKLKFSKNIVDIAQTYDLPLQPLKYRFLASGLKLKRKLKR